MVTFLAASPFWPTGSGLGFEEPWLPSNPSSLPMWRGSRATRGPVLERGAKLRGCDIGRPHSTEPSPQSNDGQSHSYQHGQLSGCHRQRCIEEQRVATRIVQQQKPRGRPPVCFHGPRSLQIKSSWRPGQAWSFSAPISILEVPQQAIDLS